MRALSLFAVPLLALAGCSAPQPTPLPRGSKADLIVVVKHQGWLTAYSGEDELVTYFNIDLGGAPAGRKRFEGDGMVPEPATKKAQWSREPCNSYRSFWSHRPRQIRIVTMIQNRDDMAAIMAAVATLQAGNRLAARTALLGLWCELCEQDTPMQRCTIAHFLADTEEEADAELAWDLLALEAATEREQQGDGDALSPELDSFLPSLHLNVGDAYRRLEEIDRARDHARFGLGRTAALPGGGYSDMVRAGLDRLLASCSKADPT